MHGFRDNLLQRVAADFDGGGDVYVTQNDAAEDGAVRVRVFGHQHDTNSRLLPRRVVFKPGL